MLLTDDQLKALLLKAKIVDGNRLAEFSEFEKSSELSLTDVLIEKDIITDEHLGMLIADSLKIPFVSLAKVFITEDIISIIPERIARKHKVIPFARDASGIKIAMVDPAEAEIPKAIQKKTGAKVTVYMATERDIYNTLRVYRKELQDTFDA